MVKGKGKIQKDPAAEKAKAERKQLVKELRDQVEQGRRGGRCASSSSCQTAPRRATCSRGGDA